MITKEILFDLIEIYHIYTLYPFDENPKLIENDYQNINPKILNTLKIIKEILWNIIPKNKFHKPIKINNVDNLIDLINKYNNGNVTFHTIKSYVENKIPDENYKNFISDNIIINDYTEIQLILSNVLLDSYDQLNLLNPKHINPIIGKCMKLNKNINSTKLKEIINSFN